MDKMQKANSVNPKPLRHGNTEPSMNDKFKACVERRGFLSFNEENGVRRTIRKLIESYRNDNFACCLTSGNRLREGYRNFSVSQYFRLEFY